jgi:cytochrome c-type biogenesis protein CcmE
MKARHRRFALIAAGVASVALACAFVLNAFRSNLMFFVTPGEIASLAQGKTQRFRLGGMVERGSLVRDADGRSVRFVVADRVASVTVVYDGALPDLFREGSGIVAQGSLDANGRFRADEVLAKHDEKYTPPSIAQAMPEVLPDVLPAAATGTGAHR